MIEASPALACPFCGPKIESKNRKKGPTMRIHQQQQLSIIFFCVCVLSADTEKMIRQFDVDNNNDDRWPSAKSIDFIYFTREMCRFLS